MIHIILYDRGGFGFTNIELYTYSRGTWVLYTNCDVVSTTVAYILKNYLRFKNRYAQEIHNLNAGRYSIPVECTIGPKP